MNSSQKKGLVNLEYPSVNLEDPSVRLLAGTYNNSYNLDVVVGRTVLRLLGNNSGDDSPNRIV